MIWGGGSSLLGGYSRAMSQLDAEKSESQYSKRNHRNQGLCEKAATFRFRRASTGTRMAALRQPPRVRGASGEWHATYSTCGATVRAGASVR